MLSRDQILKHKDLKTEVVNVPEWGGDVIVSTMTGHARDAWEFEVVAARKKAERDNKPFVMSNLRASLVARVLVDEDGQRIFSDADIEALGKKSGSALDRIYEVATKLNHLTKSDQEELTKNS